MKFLAAVFIFLSGLSLARAEDCEIIYGMRSDAYKPYEWQDKSGNPNGMNIELLNIIAAKAGCSYKIVIGGRAELLDMLKKDEITMLSMSSSATVDQFAVYIPQSIVLNRYVVNRAEDPYIENMDDWRGKTILVVSDSHTVSYLESMAKDYNLNIVQFKSHEDMTKAIVAGTGDFMITSLPVIMNLPENYKIKINGYPIMPSVYGFALNKNSPLYEKINGAMEELKASGKYFDILKKWSRPLETPAWYRYVLPAVALVLLIIVMILIWNKSLHMRVQRKTNSLNNLSKLLQMLLDVLPEHIYLMNRKGEPVWSNAAASDKTFSIDLIKTEIEQAILSENSFKMKRFLDNAQTWEVSGITLQKKEEPLLIIASNITENVRQRDESLTVDRMTSLGNMAANIAHEVNNPAGLIMHNISFLQKLSKDIFDFTEEPDSSKRFAGFSWKNAREEEVSAHTIIAENVRRIINTVEDLKKFSKKRDEAYKIVDLKNCLNNASRFIGYFVKSYTNNFTCRIDDCPLFIRGHEQHIEQIIVNLIQNSCYALTSPSQKITCSLTSSEDGRFAVLTVEDEGSGMSDDVRKKAFDTFFTTRENGTGLGLSIVASIVKEHGGKYTIESEIGKGTRIKIFFPKEQ